MPGLHGSGDMARFPSDAMSWMKKIQYVEGQEDHHRTVTFQEEYREFLKRHGIAFDERYVWD